jgi:hypothetical protein
VAWPAAAAARQMTYNLNKLYILIIMTKCCAANKINIIIIIVTL